MYTVYKIVNNTNNKYYIGVHKTNNPNDNYMGSGKAIKNAIAKYGKENFTKEILLITESKEEAYAKEKELTIDFNLTDNYNMKLGGVGGFTKENSHKGLVASNFGKSGARLGGLKSRDNKKGFHALPSAEIKENGRKGGLANKGKPKSEAHKQKIREALQNRNARL